MSKLQDKHCKQTDTLGSILTCNQVPELPRKLLVVTQLSATDSLCASMDEPGTNLHINITFHKDNGRRYTCFRIPLLHTNWAISYILLGKLEVLKHSWEGSSKEWKFYMLLEKEDSECVGDIEDQGDVLVLAADKFKVTQEEVLKKCDMAHQLLPKHSFGSIFQLTCYHCHDSLPNCDCILWAPIHTLMLEAVLTPECWTPFGPHIYLSNPRCQNYKSATETNTVQFLINSNTREMWMCEKWGEYYLRPVKVHRSKAHLLCDILLSQTTLPRCSLINMTAHYLFKENTDAWLQLDKDIPAIVLQEVKHTYNLAVPFNWCIRPDNSSSNTAINPLALHHCKLDTSLQTHHHSASQHKLTTSIFKCINFLDVSLFSP